MMLCRKSILVLGAIFLTVDVAVSLECFSCYGSGAGTRCENYLTYENALKESDRKKEEDKLLKTCTEPFNETCYIETYIEKGVVISHIRDCGDGKTFTFNSDDAKEPFYNRLRGLKMNNETVCVFDLKYMVCLSMCDTDFCNGPSGAISLVNSVVLLVVCSILGVVKMF